MFSQNYFKMSNISEGQVHGTKVLLEVTEGGLHSCPRPRGKVLDSCLAISEQRTGPGSDLDTDSQGMTLSPWWKVWGESANPVGRGKQPYSWLAS